MGLVNESDLAWEYKSKIRPWLSPFLFYIISKFNSFVQIQEPFQEVFIYKLLTSCFAFFVFFKFSQLIPKKNLLYTCFIFYLPMLIARISSENHSALFFLIGFYYLYKDLNKQNRKDFWIGILWGISFQFRYQIAFLILGSGLWLLYFKKVNLKRFIKLSLGFILILLVSIGIDSWGYGTFTFAPYNYFYSNLVQNIAEAFGTLPWNGYFDLYREEFYMIGEPILYLIIFFCILEYKHIITWTILPFILIHFYISHKETRFLFPLLYFLPYLLYIFIEKYIKIKNTIFKKLKETIVLALILFNLIAQYYFVFYAPEKNFHIMQYLNQNYLYDYTLYTNLINPYLAKNFSTMPLDFYKNESIYIKKISQKEVQNKPRPFLYLNTTLGISSPSFLKHCNLLLDIPSLA